MSCNMLRLIKRTVKQVKRLGYRWKIKENKCPRRNFKLKEVKEEEEKEEEEGEEEKEEEEEEEEEKIRKHGCTFIIYMVKKIGKKL